MRRRAYLAIALILLLLVATGSVAWAQGGQDDKGDKFVFGDSFVLRSGETLDGSLAVLGGSATLEHGSTVNGDVAMAGGKLTIAGTVQGSVAVFGGATVLDETAVIEGDFAAYGGAVERAPGAVIRGEMLGSDRPRSPTVEIPAIPMPLRPVLPWQPGAFDGFGRIISWELGAVGAGILMVLLGLLAVLVAPKALGRIASTAAGQPAFTFGVGLLTFVVALLAGALLLIACCTGLFVWLALAVGFAVGWIAVGLWVGQRVLAALKVRAVSSLLEVALGVFLITFAGRLPWCIGFLFSAIVGCIGLGAVVLTRFGTQPASGRTAGPSSDAFSAGLEPLGLPEPVLAPVVPEAEAPETPVVVDAGIELPDAMPVTRPEPVAPAAPDIPALPQVEIGPETPAETFGNL